MLTKRAMKAMIAPGLAVVFSGCSVQWSLSCPVTAGTPEWEAHFQINIQQPKCPVPVDVPPKAQFFATDTWAESYEVIPEGGPSATLYGRVENGLDQIMWTGQDVWFYSDGCEIPPYATCAHAQLTGTYQAATGALTDRTLYADDHVRFDTQVYVDQLWRVAWARATLTVSLKAETQIDGPPRAPPYSWVELTSSVQNVTNPVYYKWYINGYDAYWSNPNMSFSAGPGTWTLQLDTWDDDGDVGTAYHTIIFDDDGSGCAPPVTPAAHATSGQRFWIRSAGSRVTKQPARSRGPVVLIVDSLVTSPTVC